MTTPILNLFDKPTMKMSDTIKEYRSEINRIIVKSLDYLLELTLDIVEDKERSGTET
jgi:hypothetical protein